MDVVNGIALRDIEFGFTSHAGKHDIALTDVSFSIPRGQIVGIMGTSGAGKSTLLRLVAGLVKPSRGEISFTGGEPRIGYLFQDDVTLPWRTVGGNLQFPLEGLKLSKHLRLQRARKVCADIHLPGETYWQRRPRELSGGERRRLSLGIAIAREMDLLLLDEPTSQLDERNKWLLQDLVQEVWSTHHPTIIFVTHDLDEAIVLSDRLLILNAGSIAASFEIGMQRPRAPRIRSTPAFVEMRAKITVALAKLWNFNADL